MHNNMSSVTTCNQLTQQPSSISCIKVQGDQHKSVLRSVPPDYNKTLLVNAKGTRSRIYFLCETLDKVYTISIPKCKIPQSEPCTIHQTINNLTINSMLQDVNIFCKTVLSEYMYC